MTTYPPDKENSRLHPEQIKANLRVKGTSLAAIARELGASVAAVSQTVLGARSHRIEEAIAAKLEVSVEEAFPARYNQTMRNG